MTARSAIVGIGTTTYYARGQSWPRTLHEMACEAIVLAAKDAGLPVQAIDGFAYFAAGAYSADGVDTGRVMESLGIKEIGFSAGVTGGGGGSAGAVGLAQAAIVNGDSKYVVVVQALQQAKTRFGAAFANMQPSPDNSFFRAPGLTAPGQFAALIARRHMHEYGTRREAFAEVAISSRLNASTNPSAVMRQPITLDDYFSARMLADPLCRLDYCLESDGAVAIILTSPERAADLAQKPVQVAAAVHGGAGEWGRAFMWGNTADAVFASSGHRWIAERLYGKAGLGPRDVDVALLYDHFSPLVVMQLEDFGFCPIGEGGPFVEQGSIRLKGGSIPVNTHGGNHSEAYILGITHVVEGARQIRGTAANQLADVSVALATGGPGPLPLSAVLLTA